MTKTRGAKSFGAVLREKRMAKKITLRKFAEMIGVSATYLSQVEQDHFAPPTADRVTKIAELLGEDPDEWIRLADRVPDDVDVMVRQHPKDMPELMRLATGLSPKQFEVIKEQIRKMKKRGK
ncbi:transcriptional regulator with XRE-family HTH domain [Rhodopirellula rubra]|uniref:Transcriptional regulator with XRE-family HTH domain n=1 Tax=Aporhodopirellula rubra TaxID=980271 RepID=A0A7W5DVE1_9BACT|nr:helix-turn-helix transcriptional regulator [Aporhodopirellula rubra]MBB3205100.1 transcriptional regulator with XRE-family HTH domain [Aporhodopirellula rubra]